MPVSTTTRCAGSDGLWRCSRTGGRLYYEIAEVYEQKKMFAEAFAARRQSDILSKCPCVNTLSEAYQRAGWRGYLLKTVQLLEEVHGCDVHDYACRSVFFVEAFKACHGMRFVVEQATRFRGLVRRIGLPQPSSDKN
jgi:hypothetical protein